jgi:Anti-sigma-K factor rskA
VSHLEPDRLILLALDEEQPDAAAADHLADCPACRSELEATRHVAGLARDPVTLPAPSPGLWDRIAAEAFEPTPPRAAPPPAPKAPPGVQTEVPAEVPTEVPTEMPPRRAPEAPVRTLPAPRRRFPRRPFALVAAACLALGVVGTAAVDRLVESRDGARVVAIADLAPQPGAPAGAHGTAEVVDTGHGLQVRVTVQGVPSGPGYYTVWVYDGRDVMIPLGSPGQAPLNLPPAASDLGVFHIVDVSAQDLGQQQHGRSVLQGQLRT